MKKFFGNVAGTICGLLTALLTAFLLFAIHQVTGFAAYSFTLFFIVPVGAILSGFLAASGYYLAFAIFKARPTKMILLVIVSISTGTFFLVQYLDYHYLRLDGQPVSNMITFPTYLSAVLQHMSLSFRIGGASLGSTGSMGTFGYVVAALHILGFSLGGFAVYGVVASNPYCERCSRYLSFKASQERYFSSEAELEQSVSETSLLIEEGKYQEAVDAHAGMGVRTDGHGRHWRGVITIKVCEQCDLHWIQWSQDNEVNGDWQSVSATPLERFSDAPISQRT
jgi:hypothetical protein